jgi:hypothetical protein
MIVVQAKSLDQKGRCCGRKPIVYKRDRHLFCCRCDAAFGIDTGKQIPNWAYYALDDSRFEARTSRATLPQAQCDKP